MPPGQVQCLLWRVRWRVDTITLSGVVRHEQRPYSVVLYVLGPQRRKRVALRVGYKRKRPGHTRVRSLLR